MSNKLKITTQLYSIYFCENENSNNNNVTLQVFPWLYNVAVLSLWGSDRQLLQKWEAGCSVQLSSYKVTQLALYAAIPVDNNIEYLWTVHKQWPGKL